MYLEADTEETSQPFTKNDISAEVSPMEDSLGFAVLYDFQISRFCIQIPSSEKQEIHQLFSIFYLGKEFFLNLI